MKSELAKSLSTWYRPDLPSAEVFTDYGMKLPSEVRRGMRDVLDWAFRNGWREPKEENMKIRHRDGKVSLIHSSFRATEILTPAKARQVAKQLLKAAEAAEKARCKK